MYSLTPTVDTSNAHFGFYIVATLAGIGLISMLREVLRQRERAFFSGFIFPSFGVACIVGLVGLISYSDKPPKNEKVTATFEGFAAEVETTKSGKVSTTEHRLYGRFRVQEGTVALQVSAGAVIPPQVILYKN